MMSSSARRVGLSASILVACFVVVPCSSIFAQSYNPTNDHWYFASDISLSRESGRVLASLAGGYLVTIDDLDEDE